MQPNCRAKVVVLTVVCRHTVEPRGFRRTDADVSSQNSEEICRNMPRGWFSRMNALGLANPAQFGMGGLPGAMNFDYRGMSSAMGHHGNHGLPKLDMSAVNSMDINNSLRTASHCG